MAKKNKGQKRAASQKKQQSQHENATSAANGSTTPANMNGDANHYPHNNSSVASSPTPRRGTMSPLRWTLMFMASCYFFANAFQRELFPYGFPVTMNGSGDAIQS